MMKKFLLKLMQSHALTPVLLAFAVAAPLFALVSCSNSERRMPGDSTTTVLLKIGGSSLTKSGPMASSAPSDINAVSVTVTGAGMAPLSFSYTSVPGTIDIEVPSGPARVFVVVVTTASGAIYSGTAIASLPAGQTVSVPVVMEPGAPISLNEGTKDNPVYVPMNSSLVGKVGTGTSYYYTNPGSDTNLSIGISDLTDDADLFSYQVDSTFDPYSLVNPNFGVNYCGRTKNESVSDSFFPDGFALTYPGQYYYFTVDGSHTKHGAGYVITVMGSAVVNDLPGTILNPKVVPVGLPFSSYVASPTWQNYYMSVAKPGTQYWINLYGAMYASVKIYTDPTYIVQTTNPVTPSALLPGLFFMAQGLSMPDSFTLAVVANEGSINNPIELYPDETFGMGRANYCMVGGNTGSSYYKVPITGMSNGMPVLGYEVSVTSILSDVDLYIYSDSGFTTQISGGASQNTGTSDEVLYPIFTYFPDECMYIEVRDNNGSGSTFVLSVFNHIS
jgi:hypothetical protein